ncbi:hypothetical protein BDF19DRAFT_415852 [Syncephalis fuscata]|nr:hypothetical protein BDF19DRAFT_415852 [Syncephalis fuscata]
MKIILYLAVIGTLLATANKSDAVNRQDLDGKTVQVTFEGRCLFDSRGDVWFGLCDDTYADAKTRKWKLQKRGGYYLFVNTASNRCIKQASKAVDLADCNAEPRQLWRIYTEPGYPADKFKIISKYSDDKNNGKWDCIESDGKFPWRGHTITNQCSKNNDYQYFKIKVL